MKAVHDMSKCIQCLECISICSGGALSYHEGIFLYSYDDCTFCETCMDVCDSGAIEVKE